MDEIALKIKEASLVKTPPSPQISIKKRTQLKQINTEN